MAHSLANSFSRRRVITAVIAGVGGSLAGCLSATPEGSSDLIFLNHNENPITIDVTVTNEAGEALVEKQLEVPVVKRNTEPNASIDDVFESDGQYTVSVNVTDGPSATEQLDITGTEDDSETHSVSIDGDEITFS
ncbi:uncharacterized protein HHUB_4339 (plasmid) [Halobacterium hubeiense]|uniref:Uncharacterized protein n=1 Tax=Halobacterium hubeiense TaxID=1407499 RepID=A0A0U5HA50_9EURY|nr:hypothetical protein [Halobacterium hubeiense]CQH64265.1 uncharacterized protein HHUB_4339 [Halobacterium hubeiense]